jgi:hypothetical protein
VLASRQKEETSVCEFRKQKQAVLNLRKVESDLNRSQLACEQLDVAAGIMTPNAPWFWKSDEANDDGGEEESEEDEPMDVSHIMKGLYIMMCRMCVCVINYTSISLQVGCQLVLLTEYLREVHFYCIWCGTAYDSKH